MEMNKKGVFFSLTAIIIVGVIFIIVTTPVQEITTVDTDELQITELTEARDEFFIDLELEFAQQSTTVLREMGAIAAGLRPMSWPVSDLTSLQGFYEDCMDDYFCLPDDLGGGSYATVDYHGSLGITRQNLDQRMEIYEDFYDQFYNYDVEADLVDATFNQISPWDLIVVGVFEVKIKDGEAAGGFEVNRTVSSVIPVEGLIDPHVSSLTGDEHYIRQFKFPAGVRTWDPLLFEQHVTEGSYVANVNGTSFIDRMLGNGYGKSAAFGIQSVLPVGTYPTASIVDSTVMSYVDHEGIIALNDMTADCVSTFTPPGSPPMEVYMSRQQAFFYQFFAPTLPEFCFP